MFRCGNGVFPVAVYFQAFPVAVVFFFGKFGDFGRLGKFGEDAFLRCCVLSMSRVKLRRVHMTVFIEYFLSHSHVLCLRVGMILQR